MSRMEHPENCGCVGCDYVRAKEDAARSGRSRESQENDARLREINRSVRESANRAAADWYRQNR